MAVGVLFVSVRNACRTQMAEVWFRALAEPDKARAISAGVAPAGVVDLAAIDAMKEVGLDLSRAAPRLLTPLLEAAADLVITLAPPLPDPLVPGSRERDTWLLDDSLGASPERIRSLRGDVERLVRRMLTARQWLSHGASAATSSS